MVCAVAISLARAFVADEAKLLSIGVLQYSTKVSAEQSRGTLRGEIGDTYGFQPAELVSSGPS